jgi:hypothetical protein
MNMKLLTKITLSSVLVGSSLTMTGCPCNDCENAAVRELRLLKSALISRVRACCLQPEEDRPGCYLAVADGSNLIITNLPRIMEACEAGNLKLAREIWNEIKGLLPWYKSVPTANAMGELVNSLPLLFEDEEIKLGISATQRASVAKDAVWVNDLLYSPSAAAVAELEAGQGATVSHLLATDQNAAQFHTYNLSTSRIQLRSGTTTITSTVSGSLEISDVYTTPLGQSRAALTEIDWIVEIPGTVMDLHIDPSHPKNTIIFQNATEGMIQVVGRLASTHNPLVQAIYENVVLNLPVTFSADMSTMTIVTQDFVPGQTIAPTLEPDPDSGDMFLPVDTPPCGDMNNNGIPDFADQLCRDIDMAIEVICPEEDD